MGYRHPKTRHFVGFMWAGIFIVFVGSILICQFATDLTDPKYCMALKMTILFMASAIGLSLICSTANFWVKR